MAGVGYAVSIPVFCDSGFVLLSPLMKALARKAGITLAASAIALSLDCTLPIPWCRPRPLVAAAGIIGADLGLTIMWGLLVSLCALVVGWLFATFSPPAFHVPADSPAEMVELSPEDSPSVGKSLLPILLPIALIVLRSIAELPETVRRRSGHRAAGFLGQPVVALLIGVALATCCPKTGSSHAVQRWLGRRGHSAAATIIIITGAGGAGKVLQNPALPRHRRKPDRQSDGYSAAARDRRRHQLHPAQGFVHGGDHHHRQFGSPAAGFLLG